MGNSKRPLGWHVLGTFEVRTGKLGIWDPCYNSGDEFLVPKGLWEASVEVSDESDWGYRIARLSARSLEAKGPRGPMERYPRELGVDSGQMGMYDLRDGIETGEANYELICDLTLEGIGAGIVGDWGVASSSGYGDGGYTLYLWRNSEGQVVEALVDFIPDENEELDY